MDNDSRRPEHRKSAKLEELLAYFECLLRPIEDREISKLRLCDEPIFYIMGCARSGTTLIYQYLSASGLFTYPTNFLSRFYYAPYLGALLQKMLIESDRREEVFSPVAPSFSSRLGKTRGALSPHEFWYFWRRFFHFDDTQELSEDALKQVDGQAFIKELRSFQAVAALPLVLKGMILNWHIAYLADLYPQSFFLSVRRATPANARSLVRAREQFFGDTSHWYSFKPLAYKHVLALPPLHQTIWQVLETNAAIAAGLAHVPQDRVIDVSYEKFCEKPAQLIIDICERLCTAVPKRLTDLPQQFEVSMDPGPEGQEWAAVERELRAYAVRHRPEA